MDGVQFTAPPTHLLADATALIDTLVQQLPPDATGAVVGLATDRGWNAAVVHRSTGGGFQVSSWIGKSWGAGLTGGGAIRATW